MPAVRSTFVELYFLFRQALRIVIPLPARQFVVRFIRRMFPYQEPEDLNSVDPQARYDQWIKRYESRDILEAELNSAHLPQRLLSIVIWGVPKGSNVAELILESVKRQSYPCWEVILCSELDGSVLAQAKAEYIVLTYHEAELSPQALYQVTKWLNAHPEADLIYGDEDRKEAGGRRREPFFKPDWSPDLLLSFNYIGHLVVIRTSLLKELGGFRAGLAGAEDYDLYLRLVEKTARVRHIPKVLVHHRMTTPPYVTGQANAPSEPARQALQEHLNRQGIAADVIRAGSHWRVRYQRVNPPLVAVILLTGGNIALLSKCLAGLAQKTDYSHFELILVDNSSGSEVQQAWEHLKQPFHQATYIDRRSESFNYSRLNNEAVRTTAAPLILFLNDDIEPINADWLEAMVEHAWRPEVGAVGAKLLYADNTIQHGGVIMGIYENTSHAFKHLPAAGTPPAYFDLPNVVRDCSVVTAACLLIRREVFWEVGGFETIHLPVAFQDVDLCLKLGEKGYRNIYTPYAQLYHYESQTKVEKTPNAYEVRYIRRKWHHVIAHDPYYSPNLTRVREDYSVAYPE